MRKRSKYEGTYNELVAGKNRIIGRSDIILIVCILLCAAAMLIFYYVSYTKAQEPMLEILVRNEVYGRYPLSEDRTIAIHDTNMCEIRDGVVRMIEADCPDQLCMHQVPIDADGGNIICLPNQVILHIVDAAESEEIQTQNKGTEESKQTKRPDSVAG